MKLPHFAFYASDFLVGVLGMPMEARGAYITLLAYQWDRGPFTEAEARGVLGSHQLGDPWDWVRHKFTPTDDDPSRFTNRRLEREREIAVEKHEKRVAAGRRGGEAKASSGKQCSSNARAKLEQCSSNGGSKRLANVYQSESESDSGSKDPEPKEKVGGEAVGVRSSGADQAAAADCFAEIPSEDEVVEFGSQPQVGVPESYCRNYHARTEEKRMWLNARGQLIDWKRQLKRWWDNDRATWKDPGPKTKKPKYSSEVWI